MKKEKAITLISLVITIIILIILAGVAVNLSLGENGIFIRSNQAKEDTNKQTATEIINLKITNCQINKYAEEQRMPTLKELSLELKEDGEIEYVMKESQVAGTKKYDVGENPSSIYTKLNNYPYEFEINGSLQLASIDGIIVSSSNNNDTITISREEYENLKPKSITNESLLLEAINTNKSLGSFDLSTFENTFGSTFENYFSFDNNTGKLACKKSGWYLIDLSLEIDSAADPTSISTLSCFLNNVEISKVKVLGRNFSVLDAGSNSMTIFFNSGDEIDFKKNTTGRAAYYRLYGAVRILKL